MMCDGTPTGTRKHGIEVEADLESVEVVPGDMPAVRPKAVEAGEYELSINNQTTLQSSDDALTTTLTVENAGSIGDEQPIPGYDELLDGGKGNGTSDDLVGLFQRIGW